jgi:hypothetical protein
MGAQGITPALAVALRSLAQSQLQAQALRFAALTAGAIGVMGVDAAIAAVLVAVTPDDGVRGVALGASFGLAVRAVLLKDREQIGPLVAGVLRARATCDDRELEEQLIEDLAVDMLMNRRSIARKTPLLTGAVTFMAMAIVAELIRVVP